MKKLLIVLSAALPFAGCSDFLDPMPNGHYTDRNLLDYPSMIRGFVEKSYDLLPTSYSGGEYVYLDGATDDVVITAQTNAMRASRSVRAPRPAIPSRRTGYATTKASCTPTSSSTIFWD